ncbi:hypothetical protein [Roseovarius indicus]|uniref:hypothetical protein n=1 Tax=Roseovarius indicus TaxID=540747 RepID=UPI0010FF5A4F|nr:hypothetical protein [Roseovarius indicus]
MIIKLRKYMLAGVTASAVGVAGLAATPAVADNDTAKYIAGAAAVAIIGAAIADSNGDRYYDNPRYSTRGRYQRNHNRYNRYNGYRGHNRGYHGGYNHTHSRGDQRHYDR